MADARSPGPPPGEGATRAASSAPPSPGREDGLGEARGGFLLGAEAAGGDGPGAAGRRRLHRPRSSGQLEADARAPKANKRRVAVSAHAPSALANAVAPPADGAQRPARSQSVPAGAPMPALLEAHGHALAGAPGALTRALARRPSASDVAVVPLPPRSGQASPTAASPKPSRSVLTALRSLLGEHYGKFLVLYMLSGRTPWMAAAELLRLHGRARRYVIRHRLLARAKRFIQQKQGLRAAAFGTVACLGVAAYRMYVHYHSPRMVFRRSLVKAKDGAATYEEWLSAAQKLDRLDNSNREEWLLRKELDLYDKELVQDRLQSLRALRATGDVSEIIFALRADMMRNLGNINNPRLQEHRHGVLFPEAIESYIEETSNQLRFLATSTDDEHVLPQGAGGPPGSTSTTLDDKLAFLQEMRHAYGRTALVLSGGGALGGFHIGVVEALLRKRLLPRILAGSSVGSLMCAVICTRTSEELDRSGLEHILEFARNGDMRFFGVTSFRLMLRNFWRTGHLQELGTFVQMLRTLFGDLTFAEAYEKSGRILNISLSGVRKHEQPRLLNYLTSPNIVVWSAVAASCALPGLFPSQELVVKDHHGELTRLSASRLNRLWRDGSIEQDLPLKPLSELFNVNYFIVSQCNPHIAPLLRFKQSVSNIGAWIPWFAESSLWTKLANLVELEYKHRVKQLIEILDIRWPLAALCQTWEGDITVVLPATLRQLRRIASNPSADELEYFKLQGLRATWSKLPAIKANCLIEMTLDECVHALKSAIRKRNRAMSGKRNAYGSTMYAHATSPTLKASAAPRVPSWANLNQSAISIGSNGFEIGKYLEAVEDPDSGQMVVKTVKRAGNPVIIR